MSKSNLTENEQLEKMRYNNNSLSHKLGYCAIISSVIGAFLALNSIAPSDIFTVLKVLMNILVLLIGFLATEKVKVYKKEYSYVMYTLGGVCIARLFWVPLQLFIYWNKYVNRFNSLLEEYSGKSNAAFLAWDKAQSEYKDKLSVTILGKLNENNEISSYRSGYLTPNGNVRATLIIIFFSIAAVCFIASGVINHIRSKKLNSYLETVEKK